MSACSHCGHALTDSNNTDSAVTIAQLTAQLSDRHSLLHDLRHTLRQTESRLSDAEDRVSSLLPWKQKALEAQTLIEVEKSTNSRALEEAETARKNVEEDIMRYQKLLKLVTISSICREYKLKKALAQTHEYVSDMLLQALEENLRYENKGSVAVGNVLATVVPPTPSAASSNAANSSITTLTSPASSPTSLTSSTTSSTFRTIKKRKRAYLTTLIRNKSKARELVVSLDEELNKLKTPVQELVEKVKHWRATCDSFFTRNIELTNERDDLAVKYKSSISKLEQIKVNLQGTQQEYDDLVAANKEMSRMNHTLRVELERARYGGHSQQGGGGGGGGVGNGVINGKHKDTSSSSTSSASATSSSDHPHRIIPHHQKSSTKQLVSPPRSAQHQPPQQQQPPQSSNSQQQNHLSSSTNSHPQQQQRQQQPQEVLLQENIFQLQQQYNAMLHAVSGMSVNGNGNGMKTMNGSDEKQQFENWNQQQQQQQHPSLSHASSTVSLHPHSHHPQHQHQHPYHHQQQAQIRDLHSMYTLPLNQQQPQQRAGTTPAGSVTLRPVLNAYPSHQQQYQQFPPSSSSSTTSLQRQREAYTNAIKNSKLRRNGAETMLTTEDPEIEQQIIEANLFGGGGVSSPPLPSFQQAQMQRTAPIAAYTNGRGGAYSAR